MQDLIIEKSSQVQREYGRTFISTSVLAHTSKEISCKKTWYPVSRGSERVSQRHPFHLYVHGEDFDKG